MIPLLTLGSYLGQSRRVARGVRLACRPYADRWGEDFIDPGAALRTFAANLPPDDLFDAVTWVPGHDDSLGPGFYAAAALSRAWKIPLLQQLHRVYLIPSAHNAIVRPSWSLTLGSLEATRDSLLVTSRLLVVDNVIATGANMSAAVSALRKVGHRNIAVATCSVDLNAGSSALVHRTWAGSWTFGPSIAVSERDRSAA